MLRHSGTIDHRARAAIAAAIWMFCLSAPIAGAQNPGAITAAPASNLRAGEAATESGIPPKAMRLYRRAVRELHEGHAVHSEKDAIGAAQLDAKFADADALAATAALSQRQFTRARNEAEDAVRIDAADEKAWVILATTDNYLGRYAETEDALGHVRQQDQATWQVEYQRARAEAGQQHAAQALEWANRAALTAPSGFAPLHLLRASAFLTASQYAQAADELETYLQLRGANAPERAELTRELKRIRALRQTSTRASVVYNALRN